MIFSVLIGNKHLILMGTLTVIIMGQIVATHGMMIMRHLETTSRLILNNIPIMMAMAMVIIHQISLVVMRVNMIMAPHS